jgi:hypothetical protein
VTLARRNHGRGHSYLLDGEKVPGVTTILGAALPKPALIEWAGKTTAAYAIDHWEELGELTPSKRLARLDKARFEERDAAARRGTEVHRLAEALVSGEEVTVPDELAGHVESYVDFLDAWEPEPVLVEAVIANRAVGYCGTVDLVADMGGTRWLLDVKTARSGIFGETALQLCAYARAEVYLDDEGNEAKMADVGIDRIAGIHVRADGWDLRELRGDDEVWNTFRHLAWLARHTEDMRDWVGAALEVPEAVAS